MTRTRSTGEVLGDRRDVDVDLVAAEEVGLSEWTDVFDLDRSLAQLGERGKHHHSQVCVLGQLGELSDQIGRRRSERR